MILLDLLHLCPHLFSSLCPYLTLQARSPHALCQLASCHLSLHRPGILPTPFLDDSYLSLKPLRCCLLRKSSLPPSLSKPSELSTLPLSLQKPHYSHEMETACWLHGLPPYPSMGTALGQELSNCHFLSHHCVKSPHCTNPSQQLSFLFTCV